MYSILCNQLFLCNAFLAWNYVQCMYLTLQTCTLIYVHILKIIMPCVHTFCTYSIKWIIHPPTVGAHSQNNPAHLYLQTAWAFRDNYAYGEKVTSVLCHQHRTELLIFRIAQLSRLERLRFIFCPNSVCFWSKMHWCDPLCKLSQVCGLFFLLPWHVHKRP